MNNYEFILPAMGEGIIEATITRWFVKEGDFINEDESLLEVATDKVDSEIPAPVSGKILRVIYHEGEIPKIGEVLAIIETNTHFELELKESEGKSTEFSEFIDEKRNIESIINAEPLVMPEKVSSEKIVKQEPDDIYLTPLIRFLAKSRSIPLNELRQISGSGLNGRITKDDLNTYISSGRRFRGLSTESLRPHQENGSEKHLGQDETDYKPGTGEEIIEMDRTRRLIAEHMVRSKKTSPHVTSMVEVDVTQLVQWREANKDTFFKRYGIKLTYTPVIVEASVKALKEFPGINISVAGSNIIKKHYYNIGVATALPDGNLIVPVIKDADKCNFVSITRQLFDLADRARKGQLLPTEIKGGTFTITNMGQYENISGTPIINQPEVAILAVGAIQKKPAVVKLGNEHTIGIRDILVLSLTYDHRVVDGALGGSFVRAISRCLENNIPVI